MVALAYSVALFIFCAVGFVFYRQSRLESETQKWVIHTCEVLQKIQDVSGNLTDAESAHRGFTLSGYPDFSKSYADARDGTRKAVSDLRFLTIDNPGQQRRLDELQFVIH